MIKTNEQSGIEIMHLFIVIVAFYHHELYSHPISMCFLLFLSLLGYTKTHYSTGIGFETARQLYALGANIVLGCRSKDRAVEAMRRIIGTDYYYTEDDDDDNVDDNRPKTDTKIITAWEEREGGDGVHNNERKDNTSVVVDGGGGLGRLYFVPLDLTSRASIHEAVLAFQKLNMPLHILINNAGVMRNRREVTEDGLEMTMAANVSVDIKKVGMDIIGYMRKSYLSIALLKYYLHIRCYVSLSLASPLQ